jgi:CRP/FNR family cyclic AMP-dependent transcriptional regulator
MPARMKAPGIGTVQRIKAPGWKVLGSVPLFSGLSQRDLKRVGALAEEVWFPPGHHVIDEGKPALAFYVILDGTARVTRGASDRVLRRLGPGDYFGEMSLIDGTPRSASVVAEGTLDVIRLKRSAFRQVLRREPDVALRVMEALAGRVRTLERDLLG